jgi:hypothetical protein
MPVNVFCKINSFLKRKRTVCRTFGMAHVNTQERTSVVTNEEQPSEKT